ncbi:hypothetical protein ABK040_005208 [Willaertia magna]
MSSADTISLHNSNQYISMSNNDNRLSSSNSSITTTTTCCSDINNEEVYILPASPAINNISNSFNNINLNDNSNSTDNLNDNVIINEMSVIVDISSSYPTTEQQSFFYDNNIQVNNDDNNQSYTNDNNIHIESNEIHNDNQNINVNIEVTEMSVNNNSNYDSTTTINDCIQEDEMIIKNKKRSNANRFNNNNTNISATTATNNNITINNNTTVNNIINNIATNVDNKTNKSKYIIEVLDPIKEGTGLSARTTYLISTKFIQSNQLFYVRRRYKEFKKLFDEMTKLRGVNLSSFPKKQFKKFEDKVVEERRVAFEIILREMIEHEQVLMSPLFREFIGVSDIPTQSPSNSASPIIGSTNDFVTINLK